MSEGRRLVSFHQKMSCPGETIADRNPQQRPDVMARRDRREKHSKAEQSPAGVQHAVSGARMLLEIEREELFVAGELRVAHCHSPETLTATVATAPRLPRASSR